MVSDRKTTWRPSGERQAEGRGRGRGGRPVDGNGKPPRGTATARNIKEQSARRLGSDPNGSVLTHLLAGPFGGSLSWGLPNPATRSGASQRPWAVFASGRGGGTATVAIAERLEDWLNVARARPFDPREALECLAWCQSLPRLASMVSGDLWFRLLDRLLETPEAAADLPIRDCPTAHQLLNGELRLTLACHFPGTRESRRMWTAASRALSAGAVELLDGEGLLNARHLPEMQMLLACWTRCSVVARALGRDCFHENARRQYRWMVRQWLRLCRPDGSRVLSESPGGTWCPDLAAAALGESGDQMDEEIARRVLPGRRRGSTKGACGELPPPSVHAEWAETCVMRARWSRTSPLLAMTFANRVVQSELVAAGRLVWSGQWTCALRVDGNRRDLQSDWRELCWFTDKDVDYLELEAKLDGGWVIQRQALLSRSDHFLFLADAVIGPRRARVDFRGSLPLAAGVRWENDGHTRDGRLSDGRPLSVVFPLSLPEWHATSVSDSLHSADGLLTLSASDDAQRLYAPLFFDLSPRRFLLPRTWRQLTVAQRYLQQPRETAVGYRVQCGWAQWLVYRSLGPSASRSVLGQNVSGEFLVARVKQGGCVEHLMGIE